MTGSLTPQQPHQLNEGSKLARNRNLELGSTVKSTKLERKPKVPIGDTDPPLM